MDSISNQTVIDENELEDAKIKNYKIFPLNERNYLYIKGQK